MSKLTPQELWFSLLELSACAGAAEDRIHEAERQLKRYQQLVREIALRLGAQPPDVLSDSD